MNLENKILEKIKKENLKPTSIWYFIVKDFSLWGLVFLSIVLASLAIAPILFIISNLEYGFIKHLTDSPTLFVLLLLPYHWLMLCFVTTFLAKLSWQKTRHGYKFQGKYIIIISTILSLIFGIILNQLQFGKKLDDTVNDPVFHTYKSVQGRYEENWFNPKEGRILGVVTEISTSSFQIYNERNNFLEIISFDEDVPGYEFINEQNKIRVVGFENENNDFFACAIFPDSFLPPRQRGPEQANLTKEKIKQKVIDNPECKEVIAAGRANFKKKI